MEKSTREARGPRQGSFWKAMILWIAAAALLAAGLTLVIDHIWKHRTQTRVRKECDMVANALLMQGISDEKSILEWRRNWRQFFCSQNAIAAWAAVYGGTDEEELKELFELMSYDMDGLAFLQNDRYVVLSGDFPREEFERALKERKSMTSQMDYSLGSDVSASESEGLLGGTAAATVENDVWYYSVELELADAIVISKDIEDAMTVEDQEKYLLSLLDQMMSDTEMSVLVLRESDNTVLWKKGDLQISKGDRLRDDAYSDGVLKLGGSRYTAGYAQGSGYRIFTLVTVAESAAHDAVAPLVPAVMFAFLFLLTVLYAWFLRIDILRGRVEYEKDSRSKPGLAGIMVRHVRLVFVLIAICLVGLFLLLSALYVVDDTRAWGARILEEIETYLEGDDQNADLVVSSKDMTETLLSDAICFLADRSPDRMEEDAFVDLGAAIQRELFLLNHDGTVEVSTLREYDLSAISDPESDLGAMQSVLSGKANHVTTSVTIDSNVWLCRAARRQGHPGILICMEDIGDPVSSEEYYGNYLVPEGLLLISVDTETGEILSSSEERYAGRRAASIGLKGDVLKNGFVGDITLDGQRHFIQTMAEADETRANVIATKLSYLFVLYSPVVLGTVAVGILAVLLMLYVVYILQRGLWSNLPVPDPSGRSSLRRDPGKPSGSVQPSGETAGKPGQEKKTDEEEIAQEEENATFYREKDGGLHADQTAVGRWMDITTPFRIMSADEKFRFVIHMLLIVSFLAGYMTYQVKGVSGIMSSTLAFLLQHNWCYGINVYAVSYAVLSLITVFVLALFVRRLILMICSNFGSRGETIGRLLGSFIGYASLIGAIAYSLMFLGVNTMTMLASAGIIGLGISIGAKDLIADILAGISIVFEGEFRTGDIVEIDGFRGEVEEIGVRTTKVMSMGNVKVFRNSGINGVINLTQRNSIAQAKIHVSRAEPVEKVEEIFKKALPGIRKKIPQANDRIELCGIDQMDPYFIILLFQTRCRERDRILVERLLSRELDLLMEKENLGSRGLWKE